MKYYIIESLSDDNHAHSPYYWPANTIIQHRDSNCFNLITEEGREVVCVEVLVDHWMTLYNFKEITEQEYNYLKGLYLL